MFRFARWSIGKLAHLPGILAGTEGAFFAVAETVKYVGSPSLKYTPLVVCWCVFVGPQPSAPPPYPGDNAPQAFPASGYPPGYSTPQYAQPAVPPPSYYSQQQTSRRTSCPLPRTTAHDRGGKLNMPLFLKGHLVV